jgi:predicted DCC family thiol-disulfide oxidoreductase YuxK
MTPILLFDGDCHVCRIIAHWIERSAKQPSGPPSIIVQAIGQDPAVLHALNPTLDIWAAYADPHVLMPDGSMLRAGYAVAEVFRLLPNTRWFAGIFAIRLFGKRPFQTVLNAGYVVLADIRPLLGCDSCGRPSPWVRPLIWLANQIKALTGRPPKTAVRHFTHVKKTPAKALPLSP